MSELYACDFSDDTAFELYVLSRVVPPVPNGIGTASVTIDLASGNRHFTMGVCETLGMTLADAVDSLGIRPLAFGAAWKMVDLLLEYALVAASVAPLKPGRWSIAEKVRHARALRGQATPLSSNPNVWRPLLYAYAENEQARHSLVHRRAQLDANGAIVGVDTSGVPLRPVTVDEQVSFCCAAQLAHNAVTTGCLGPRLRDELLWYLDRLSGLTGVAPVGVIRPQHPVPTANVPVVSPYVVDLTFVKERLRSGFPTATHIDVIFTFDTLERHYAELEDVPDGSVTLVPDTPAPWSRAM